MSYKRRGSAKLNQAFARFRSEHAEQVTFIELLHVPAVGRSDLTIDLDKQHLLRLYDAIEQGDARHIFREA